VDSQGRGKEVEPEEVNSAKVGAINGLKQQRMSNRPHHRMEPEQAMRYTEGSQV